MSYLLFIHVGPVQEFIAAARRTRDLWFGSWMLSELAKAVAKTVADGATARLIFPAVADVAELDAGSSLDAPNKIVVEVGGDPRAVAEAARETMLARLRELWEAARAQLPQDGYDRGAAEQQIMALPEFYWVAVPQGDDYPADRALGEALLAARKNTRQYQQPTWASGQPKSSLDGRLEAVIEESAYPKRRDLEADQSAKQAALYERYRISGAERLSGVDLLKRMGNRSASGDGSEFPSTSHMAALSAVTGLLRTNGEAWQRFVEALRQVESSLVHANRLREPFDYGTGDDRTRLDASLIFRRRLEEQAQDMGKQREAFMGPLQALWDAEKEFPKEPIPYYAILLGDGDGMGEKLSELTSAEEHRIFSQKLSAFARQVSTVIGKHRGAVIYAGGDDVLALLPLYSAIEAATDVATCFRATMRDYGVTFSAGLAITHFMEPLSDSLALARRAEKIAKAVRDKNALAVTVSKRSGADRTVVGKWGELDTRLLRLAGLHRQEDVPDGAAYQIQDVVMEVGGPAALKQDTTLRRIVQLEAERILGRKRRERGREEMEQSVMRELLEFMGGKDGSEALVLAQQLIVSKLFADAKDEAHEPLEKSKEDANG